MDSEQSNSDREIELRKLSLEQQQLKLEEKKHLIMPICLALVTALLGILTTAVNNYQTALTANQNAQTSLLLKLSELKDEKLVAKSMLFYGRLGLLQFPDNYTEFLEQTANIKASESVLPAPIISQTEINVPKIEQLLGFEELVKGNLADARKHFLNATQENPNFGCSWDLAEAIRKQGAAIDSTAAKIDLRNQVLEKFYGYLTPDLKSRLKAANNQ